MVLGSTLKLSYLETEMWSDSTKLPARSAKVRRSASPAPKALLPHQLISASNLDDDSKEPARSTEVQRLGSIAPRPPLPRQLSAAELDNGALGGTLKLNSTLKLNNSKMNSNQDGDDHLKYEFKHEESECNHERSRVAALRKSASQALGYVKEEPPVRPLEWTQMPVREVKRDGHARCSVSNRRTKLAAPNGKDHNLHLVRTTRIEPERSSRPSSRSSSRQNSGRPSAREEIVVTEADFKRCGKSMTLLRGCQLEKLPYQPKEEAPVNELEMSFKSAFRKRCSSADHAAFVDPWKSYKNPEEVRDAYEGDLVLNQVWVDSEKHALQARNVEDDEDSLLSARSGSTCASPTDVIASWPLGKGRGLKDGGHSQHRKTSQGEKTRRRAKSQGCLTMETTMAPDSAPRERTRRPGRHASGCPKPNSGDSSPNTYLKADGTSGIIKEKKVEYKSRIQLIDDEEEEEVWEDQHDSEFRRLDTRAVARMQRRFEQKIDESNDTSKPMALWLSLDALSGQVTLFPRAVASRLEGAYVNNRSTVPLAGLNHQCLGDFVDDEFEDDIVFLGTKGGNDRPVQKSAHGGQTNDVRRLQLRGSAEEAFVNVVWDGMWGIADVAEPGRTEQRRVGLNGTELVRPPSPPLPPLNPDRRVNFCNIGATAY
jgi:hypothetical protein